MAAPAAATKAAAPLSAAFKIKKNKKKEREKDNTVPPLIFFKSFIIVLDSLRIFNLPLCFIEFVPKTFSLPP
jgi:hypothetical protein